MRDVLTRINQQLPAGAIRTAWVPLGKDLRTWYDGTTVPLNTLAQGIPAYTGIGSQDCAALSVSGSMTARGWSVSGVPCIGGSDARAYLCMRAVPAGFA